MNNNKGFTLVELLGSMVILGLLMVMVVPNIVGILSKNKEKTYKEDAKKLVEVAKYKISMKKDVQPPTVNNKCVVMGLGYLDNAEFANPPNGGCYDVTRSFVIAKLENHRYEYYVQLVEYFDGKYTGIALNESGVVKPIKFNNLENASLLENANINYSYFNTTPGENNSFVISDEMSNQGITALQSLCPHTPPTNYGYQNVVAHNGPKTYSSDSRGICAQKNV